MDNSMCVTEWLDIWVEEFLCSVKPRTVQKYRSIIENHLKPGLGEYPLNKLDGLTIQRFYNDQVQGRNGWRAISPKTLKDLHGILHEALQQAVNLGYITRNPTCACKIPRVEKPEISPLDSDQIAAFLKAIKGHRFEALYIVTLFTGMRRAEVLRFREKHRDAHNISSFWLRLIKIRSCEMIHIGAENYY